MEENTLPTPQASNPISTQVSTMLITKKDIEAAFKLFYNRSPLESDNIEQYIGAPSSELLLKFLISPEFLLRPGIDNLVLNVAQKIQKKNAQLKPT